MVVKEKLEELEALKESLRLRCEILNKTLRFDLNDSEALAAHVTSMEGCCLMALPRNTHELIQSILYDQSKVVSALQESIDLYKRECAAHLRTKEKLTAFEAASGAIRANDITAGGEQRKRNNDALSFITGTVAQKRIREQAAEQANVKAKPDDTTGFRSVFDEQVLRKVEYIKDAMDKGVSLVNADAAYDAMIREEQASKSAKESSACGGCCPICDAAKAQYRPADRSEFLYALDILDIIESMDVLNILDSIKSMDMLELHKPKGVRVVVI